jgi:DHA3 family macrolide efflux protein-like MFS transporter
MSTIENSDTEKSPRSFQTKGYLTIYASQALSLMGSSVVSFALTWYLTIETGSAVILSLGMFVGMVPMLIIAPFAGVLSDRLNKKILLISSDLLQALAVIILIYLFNTGLIEIWHILVLLAIRGIAQAFQMPVNLTLPAIMLSKETIPRVNALNSILSSLIYIASPAMGAVLLGYFSMGDILWVDIITYIPAFLVLLIIKIPKIKNQETIDNVKSSFKKEFIEGLSYIKTSGLMPLIVTSAILSIFINPLFNLIPLFIAVVHLGGANELALIEIGFQIGIFAGSLGLLLLKVKPSFRNISIGIISLFVLTFIMALVPAKQNIPLTMIVFVIGLSISFVDVQFLSLMQIIIPQEIQGRVFSSVFTIMKSSIPISVIFLGIFADMTSIHFVFLVVPFVAFIIAAILLLTTGIRKMDQSFKTGKYAIKKVTENTVIA